MIWSIRGDAVTTIKLTRAQADMVREAFKAHRERKAKK